LTHVFSRALLAIHVGRADPYTVGKTLSQSPGAAAMRLNPPSIFVFLISVVLAALALLSKFGAIGVNVPRYLPHQEYWLAMIAYLVLMVGNLVRGL
jgi:hypothetical protein